MFDTIKCIVEKVWVDLHLQDTQFVLSPPFVCLIYLFDIRVQRSNHLIIGRSDSLDLCGI